MKINGLKFVERVEAQRYWDLCSRTETHSIGGGEWSLELYDSRGRFLKEYVGSNGTQSPKDDLYTKAKNDPDGIPAYTIFEAPDGTKGSIGYFKKEARMGHLHGCTVIM